LKNFKTLEAFKKSDALKSIYTIPKKPVLGMMSDEPSIVKLGKIRNISIFLIYIKFFIKNKNKKKKKKKKKKFFFKKKVFNFLFF